MKKMLLATALMVTAFVPTLAEAARTPDRDPHQVRLGYEHQLTTDKARIRSEGPQSNTVDPYWTPCNYYDDWSINSCE